MPTVRHRFYGIYRSFFPLFLMGKKNLKSCFILAVWPVSSVTVCSDLMHLPSNSKTFLSIPPFLLSKPSSSILKLLLSLCFSSSSPPMSSSQTRSLSGSTRKQLDPPNDSEALATAYPTPLSPPLPAISKEIELKRAMTATSKSSTFSLSRKDIIFEDEWLIVVNKPQGIYCESVLLSVPLLLENSGDSDRLGNPAGTKELHLANRLDRDTSGLMVITKSHKVAGKLVKAFTDHRVKKTYIALCVGVAPDWDRVRIRSGHGRSKFGAFRVYAASDVGRSLPGGSAVKDMETVFEVLSRSGSGGFRMEYESEEGGEEEVIVVEEKSQQLIKREEEILVRASPRSGRTHQIRLHCQYLGLPIRGDVKYEGVCEWEGEVCDGHVLHAESLSFEHPITCQIVQFQAPLPSWVK